MAGYSPMKITGMTTGLVQNREEFILPNDAYPTLQNAYVWRERILRKKGYQLLGRLQRNIGTTNGSGNLTVTISPVPIQTGLASFTVGTDLFNDPGTTPNPGTQILLTNSTGTGALNRVTGVLTITGSQINTPVQYFPALPVMGIRTEEIQNSANDRTIFFDQQYAYVFSSITMAFQEFIPGTTWNAHGGDVTATDFFWSTNYWVSSVVLPGTVIPFFTTTNIKLFWVTNNTGQFGANADPIRITDGITWVDFSPPNFGQIDATNFLVQCLSFLPYRGRLVAFNTWEGPNYASAQNFSNRIRWCTIGNPFIPFSAGPPATGSWRDDIRGQGGYLDMPTSEDIIAIGFVRDNLVIYCERSTWQLRYTGRSIAPFQIERVNSELGTQSPYSAVQFDTSLVGIGDKGIVECDSYKSERIDIKIPDLVWTFQNQNNGVFRVQGIRDFENRLAFWTFVEAAYDPSYDAIFPNQRLVYNYENDSWALFDDSLTALGNYQPQTSRNWINTPIPWIQCNFPWINQVAFAAEIVGGNQQGFVEYLDELTVNDVSLFISNITAHTITPTVVTSPNHNMKTGFVIGISGIPTGTPFANLNGGIFGIIVIDGNNFRLMLYNSTTMEFSTPQLDVPTTPYEGGGLINIRENFSITSKKFNFLDEGQNIQMGYLDILMASTEPDEPGAISLYVYLDYNDVQPSNTTPLNEINDYSPVSNPDTFFNSIIPTTTSSLNMVGGTKFWQRVYCSTRANFLTLEYTFSNAQLAGEEQTKDIQIDAQVLWIRKAGRMTQI
jgi:hypothetical protein